MASSSSSLQLAVQRYRQAHRHPINRTLHIVGIPLIVFSLAVAGRSVAIGSYITLTDILAMQYVRNYYEHDRRSLIPMVIFFGLMDTVAYLSQDVPYIYVYCILLQMAAWSMQIIGHRFYEGNRPVLMDSIGDAVAAAPLLLYYEMVDIFTAL